QSENLEPGSDLIRTDKALAQLGALVGLSVALAACGYTGEAVVTAGISGDYRQRPPIAVQEAKESIVIFGGQGRGGLSPSQRADVTGLASAWVREGTGIIVADVPVETPNARAAAASFREVRSLLIAGGVPSRGIVSRSYHPGDSQMLAPIRL